MCIFANMVSKNMNELSMISGYNGLYAINRNGQVFRKKGLNNWKELKQYIIAGYNAVGLCVKGKRTIKHVHRILAITYLPNPENKRCVNHIDGNKLNNELSNLEWATYSENSRHAFDIGLSTHSGENCHTAIINSNIAKAIYLLKDEFKQSELCKMFDLKPNVIYKIHNRISWKNETSMLGS